VMTMPCMVARSGCADHAALRSPNMDDVMPAAPILMKARRCMLVHLRERRVRVRILAPEGDIERDGGDADERQPDAEAIVLVDLMRPLVVERSADLARVHEHDGEQTRRKVAPRSHELHLVLR